MDDFSLFMVKAYVDRLNHEQQKSAKVTLKILKRKEFWMIFRWKDPEGVFQIRRAVVPARKRQGYTEIFKTERILDDFSLFMVKAYVDRLNHEQRESAKIIPF